MIWPCLLHTTVQYWIWGSQERGADHTTVTKVTHSEEGPQVGSGTPGTTQITKSCPSTAANLPICAESTQVLARLQEWFYNRGGGAEAGGSDRR